MTDMPIAKSYVQLKAGSMDFDYGSMAPGVCGTGLAKRSSADGVSVMRRRASKIMSSVTDGENGTQVNQFEELRQGRTLGLEAYTNSYLNLLLVFVPPGLLWGALGWSHSICFVFCFFAIIPCACIVGQASEDIAEQTNETVS
jgi:hypothetical protein